MPMSCLRVEFRGLKVGCVVGAGNCLINDRDAIDGECPQQFCPGFEPTPPPPTLFQTPPLALSTPLPLSPVYLSPCVS